MEIAELVGRLPRTVDWVSLSDEQVKLILEGKAGEVYRKIKADTREEIGERDYYWRDIAERLNISIEKVQEWFRDDGFAPDVTLSDSDWKRALQEENSQYTAVLLDCPLDLTNWNVGLPVNYAYISTTLKVLGINPMEFRKTFKDNPFLGYFPDEDRSPSVDLKDFSEEFVNGMVCVCVTSLAEIEDALKGDQMIFKAGTVIAIYDYNTGNLSCKMPLLRDIKVRKKGVRFIKDYEMENELSYVVDIQEWSQGRVKGATAPKNGVSTAKQEATQIF